MSMVSSEKWLKQQLKRGWLAELRPLGRSYFVHIECALNLTSRGLGSPMCS